MRISRLKLTNWKNFPQVDVALEYRVFIVGPNASGKSNLLDAIRFLRDIVRQGGGLQEAVFGLRDGVSKIRCVAARKNSDISIGVVINNEKNIPEWEYELTFNQTGGGISDLRAVVKKEFLKNLIDEKIYIDRQTNHELSDYQAGFTYIEQASINEQFRSFVEFLSEISYLHLIPQLVRDPKSFLKTTKGEDYFGRDFLERIQKMNKKTREAYLRRITNGLKRAIPNLMDLQFVTDDMGVPHFEATFSQWRGKGLKHTERQFSDGTLRLIGLLWSLQDGAKPILLEEPELSLHASIVSSLPDIIYQLQNKKSSKRQVILTTHSYDLLNNKSINPEEILLVETLSEGSRVLEGAKIKEIKDYLQFGLPVGELLVTKTKPNDILLDIKFD
ncbi:MAG: AAA family ATPase [Bacteroidales bacterium]